MAFMDVFHRSLADGVDLIGVTTEKFKTSAFSVTLAVPLRKESATANALIGEVLNRGSRNYPNIEALSAATDELYGMSLQPRVRQKGETQCVGFVAGFLEDLALLQQAQNAARNLLEHDPGLEQPEHRSLVAQVQKLFDCLPGGLN